MEVKKVGFTVPITWEMIADYDRRPRKIKKQTWVEVDPREVLAFRKWKKAFKKLRKEGYARRWYEDGGNDYGPEFHAPTGHWEYEYEED